jgi:hypothetical protein
MSETENVTLGKDTTTIPAAPSAMLDVIIMQLEGAITTTPAPDYVKEACTAFIESLKRWGREGAN